jgi:cytoskeletal protein CcmA (bactofilin family)
MRNITVIRISMVVMLALTLAAGIFHPAQAAKIDDDGKVAADEVIDDDLFLSGDQVTMDGTINGNLFASGNMVTINGTVNGDLFIGGNNVVVSQSAVIQGNVFFGSSMMELAGTVAGSVFGGSGALTVADSGDIGRNLYYGGYSLEMTPGSKVGTDLLAGAYQAILQGDISDDINIGAAAVELSGKAGGDVTLDVESPSGNGAPFMMPFMSQPGYPASIEPGLRIDENAVIGGKLTYTSPVEQTGTIGVAPEGGIVYQTPVPDEDSEAPAGAGRGGDVAPFLTWLFGVLRKMVTLIILGVLSVWLLPKVLKQAVEQARTNTLPSAGYGVVTVIVGYVGVVLVAGVILAVGLLISAITLGGLSRAVFGVGYSGLALVMALFTLLVSYGSKLVVAYLGGEWLMNKIAPTAKGKGYWAIILGVVIYVLLAAIPFIGWLVALLATVIGMGALWLVYHAWRESRKTVLEPVQA